MNSYLPITIDMPWWGAWKKFGWPKSTWGIGIKRAKIEAAITAGYSQLRIHVADRKTDYLVSPSEVERYAMTHNTMYKARGGVVLYVVPESLLHKVVVN